MRETRSTATTAIKTELFKRVSQIGDQLMLRLTNASVATRDVHGAQRYTQGGEEQQGDYDTYGTHALATRPSLQGSGEIGNWTSFLSTRHHCGGGGKPERGRDQTSSSDVEIRRRDWSDQNHQTPRR